VRAACYHRSFSIPDSCRYATMPGHRWLISAIATLFARVLVARAGAGEQILTDKLHHLRSGTVREWADFPEEAEAKSLILKFQARTNATEQTLRLRQRDVKQTWSVR